MSDKDFKKTEPFVPTRDDRIGERAAAKTKPTPRNAPLDDYGHNDAPGKGSVGWLWKMLVFILLLGVGGLGFVIYQQEQRQVLLQQQFDDLQYRISSTDESLSQSGATLGMKLQDHDKELKKHFSEIDKLWAARNANKRAVEAATKDTAALKKQLGSVATQAKQAQQSVTSASQEALAVRAELEEIETLADSTLARLDGMERSLKQWQVAMNKRVAGNEEAIRAIDSFRRQTNSEIQQLKQRLQASSTLP